MRCAECKGNLLCGRSKCPLVEKHRFLRRISVSSEIHDPTPPSIFVGRIGYPKVYAGPLIALNVDPVYADSPWMWRSIEEVIKLRTSMLRASTPLRVDDVRAEDRKIQELQELTAAMGPVDVEAEVRRLRMKTMFDDVMLPMGYTATVEKLRITGNPKIPEKVERIYHDDIKANIALRELYKHGFSTYYLQKILSAGMLGERKNRRLVPTRWAITAVHSMLGEDIKREIVEFTSVDETMVFSFEHFGNHFEVILSPEQYSFQLIEIWKRKSFWSPKEDWIGSDWEDVRPKKSYSPLGGGYYAARLPVLEFLKENRRQASIVVIREIKPSYYAPLGVWVVEEGVRKAMKSKPEVFESFNDALTAAAGRIETELRLWMPHLRRQTTLHTFFKLPD